MGVTGVVGIPILNLIRGVDCFIYPSYNGGRTIFNRSRVSRATGRLKLPILTGLPVTPGVGHLISRNGVRRIGASTLSSFIRTLLRGWAREERV